jgi:hypothetical protein
VKIRISETIAYEYDARGMEGYPGGAGVHDVSEGMARELFADAEYHAHRHGPEYDIGTKSAYRALAIQIGKLIGKQPDFRR